MAKYRIKDICDSNLLNIRNLSGDVSINYLDTSSITHGVISEYQVLRLKDAPSRAQRMVSNGTIIYSLVRPNLCHYGYIDRPIDNLVVSTGFITLNLKKSFRGTIDIKFLYLLLTQPSLTQYLHIIAQNAVSAYPSLTPSDIERLTFDFPEYDVQKRISSLFFDIDSKIALNREINRNLEAMARQLYDYWFVQFDFPDENGRPYKSSGGKMVWNEKLKREIPEGWRVVSVNDISESQRGVSYDKTDISEEGIQVLRGNNIENNHYVSDSNIVIIPEELVSEEQHIKKYDIIMTMSSGSKEHVGKCMQFQSDSIHTFGAFLNRFRPTQHPHYLFLYLSSPFFKLKVKSLCNGTGINNLTYQNFNDIVLTIAGEKIMKDFDSIVVDLYNQIGENESQIEYLTNQRDGMLPLLMNGQVSVTPSEVNCDLYLLQLSILLTFDHIVLHNIRTPLQGGESCRGDGKG